MWSRKSSEVGMQVESSSQLHSLPYLSQISRIESNKINRVFISGVRGEVLYVQGMEVLTDLVGKRVGSAMRIKCSAFRKSRSKSRLANRAGRAKLLTKQQASHTKEASIASETKCFRNCLK